MKIIKKEIKREVTHIELTEDQGIKYLKNLRLENDRKDNLSVLYNNNGRKYLRIDNPNGDTIIYELVE